jgi:hypothetical protein
MRFFDMLSLPQYLPIGRRRLSFESGRAYKRIVSNQRTLHGEESYETRLGYSRSSRAEGAREEENACGEDRENIEAQRGRDATEGLQHGAIARLALTNSPERGPEASTCDALSVTITNL